jgi:hypothetical protein
VGGMENYQDQHSEVETEVESEDSASGSEMNWWVFAGLLLFYNILREIFQVWLVKYLAMGASFLVIGLITYRFRSPKFKVGFWKWALWILVYAAGYTLAMFGLYLVIE